MVVLVGVAILIAAGATWYAIDKNSRSGAGAVQNMPQKTSVSQQQTQEQKSMSEANREAVLEDNADPNEESFEKKQTVSSDTSLNAIDKELDQTDVSEVQE